MALIWVYPTDYIPFSFTLVPIITSVHDLPHVPPLVTHNYLNKC